MPEGKTACCRSVPITEWSGLLSAFRARSVTIRCWEGCEAEQTSLNICLDDWVMTHEEMEDNVGPFLALLENIPETDSGHC